MAHRQRRRPNSRRAGCLYSDMMRPLRYSILALTIAAGACGPRLAGDVAQASRDSLAADTRIVAAPDSTWIRVAGPTMIAFHPVASNAQLEADGNLASVLDDLAYHVGSAMDDLTRSGIAVHYQTGDSVKLLLPGPAIWVRASDSASVGLLFADPKGNRAVLYGVRTSSELVELAAEFARSGRVIPR